jgi:hypothetical protein
MIPFESALIYLLKLKLEARMSLEQLLDFMIRNERFRTDARRVLSITLDTVLLTGHLEGQPSNYLLLRAFGFVSPRTL